MLTHQFPCIKILNSTQFKPSNSSNIFLETHNDQFRSNQPNGIVFNSGLSLNEQWAVRGQPTHQASSGTKIHGHFRPHTPKHNLMHKLSHKLPKQSMDCPKRASKISILRSQDLRPIKRPLTASNQPNH